ncbi:hypothetical protein S141_12 [Shewanella sp. phage 1/41]|uniref:hypothetical protein n=1 Tax=Shewanella sp. phage 1/41 TaxID=1458861 RepID=UPI0004F5C4C0|nr:hypothetical protein S141_12 [Shewanella sp. phage 1/41]AHK11658.1 hypothetical protein S141_12 [Shewanella sp. phage 1/41]
MINFKGHLILLGLSGVAVAGVITSGSDTLLIVSAIYASAALICKTIEDNRAVIVNNINKSK